MKEIIEVKGMHCRSCEILIEDKVKQVPGIKSVHANSKRGNVIVTADDGISREEILKAIRVAGYSVGKENLPFIEANTRDILFIVGSFFLLAILYLLGSSFGLEKYLTFGAAGPSTSLAVIFTIGVTAGLSSCMALIGGLVLGASARYAEKHPDATPIQKFRPHLFFNLGRIIGFFILGGIIGSLGSIIKLTPSITGYFTIIVGLFMLLLGVQLLEIFPRFSFSLTLPKGLSRLLGLERASGAEYSHKNSVVLGVLTFFLPCGFTQAMQVYAISTGSFVTGAIIMGVFALGTTPGLLGIGGLTSILKKGRSASFFYKFVGVLVILLSLFNLINGLTLTGLRTYLQFNSQNKTNDLGLPENLDDSGGKVATSTEVQVLKATYDQENVVTPKKFTFKVGVPARLEIFAKEDGSGCMGSIMIPNLVNQPQFFVKDKTVILEFTPKKTGKYYLTCAMGVPAGSIEIVN